MFRHESSASYVTLRHTSHGFLTVLWVWTLLYLVIVGISFYVAWRWNESGDDASESLVIQSPIQTEKKIPR